MADPRPLLRPWNAFGDTLGALLDARAGADPSRTFVVHIGDDGVERPADLAGTRARALGLAAGLAERGVRRGDRVLIVLPTGPAFVETFFAAGYAGAAAVPVYPPMRSRGIDEYEARLARLIAVASPALIVADPRVRLVVEAAAFRAGSPARVIDAEGLRVAPGGFVGVPTGADEAALIQFSSGSTGHPRGVVLSHRQALENLTAVVGAIPHDSSFVHVTWLPLYHDMGLLGGVLMPLFAGVRVAMLSPQSFLLDPKRWLWAIHRHRGTCSTAPNFAYQLVASRLDDRELAGLDLSCWRFAMNGAEPIHAATLEAFAERLAPYGFRREALMPVYGMAEVALAATFHDPTTEPMRVDPVDAGAFALGEARPAEPATGAPIRGHVSVGRPLPGFAVRVTDEADQPLAERRIGEIQVRGPSLMTGYLGDPAATAAALADGWLRTGDLGYLADGDLFVVGRRKDLIVKAGRNWAPQDLERAAEGVAGVRKGCVAAFGVPDPATGTEAIVVVAETREPADRHAALGREVMAQVAAEVGIQPDQVAMVPPGAVPKTSSGKLQRGRCRDQWLAGELAGPSEPGWLGRAGLFGRAIAHRARLPLAGTGDA